MIKTRDGDLSLVGQYRITPSHLMNEEQRRPDPGLWSRSRRLGLETVSRRTNVSSRSRLEKNCQHLGLVSVSRGRRLGLVSVLANYVSCPRPILGQIVQATLTKRT